MVIIPLSLAGAFSTLLATSPVTDASQPATPAKPALVFQAYDGDPKNPAAMHFQVSNNKRNHFLQLGDTVPKTTFKLTKFEIKTREHPKYGKEDASELTLTNSSTGETLVLAVPSLIHIE